MNTKRQTIWLVSMLGLMVVLSAYYLFTDNTGDLATSSDENIPEGTAIDSVETGDAADLPDLDGLSRAEEEWETPAGWDDLSMREEHGQWESEAAVDDNQDGRPSGDQPEKAASGSSASGDEQILNRVRSGPQNGDEYIAALEMERNNALSREIEELFNVTLDQSRSPEEVARADERLRRIEETQAIVDDLEGQLLQQFENVVITEANGKWNVVVKADKLERSQVVTIIDMVAEGLNVSAGDVVVERVS